MMSENKTTIEELEEQFSRLADFSLRRSGLILEFQDRIKVLEREFVAQTRNEPQSVKQSRISEDMIEKHYEDKMEEIDRENSRAVTSASMFHASEITDTVNNEITRQATQIPSHQLNVIISIAKNGTEILDGVLEEYGKIDVEGHERDAVSEAVNLFDQIIFFAKELRKPDESPTAVMSNSKESKNGEYITTDKVVESVPQKEWFNIGYGKHSHLLDPEEIMTIDCVPGYNTLCGKILEVQDTSNPVMPKCLECEKQ
jgi:hypothetical protein